MEQTAKTRFIALFRNPGTLVIAAVAVLVALNAVFFFSQAVPSWNMRQQAAADLDTARKQLAGASGQPDPQKAADSDIAALLKEVPVRIVLSELFREVFELAVESGIQVTALSQNEQAGGVISSLEETMNTLLGQNAAPEDAKAEPDQQTSIVERNAGLSEFVPSSFRLLVTGTVPGLIRFYDLLVSSPRIITVDSWKLNVQNSEDELVEEVEPSVIPAEDKSYFMELVFTTFTAPSYKGPFGIEDESMTPLDDALGKLQAQYPDIKLFQSTPSAADSVAD